VNHGVNSTIIVYANVSSLFQQQAANNVLYLLSAAALEERDRSCGKLHTSSGGKLSKVSTVTGLDSCICTSAGREKGQRRRCQLLVVVRYLGACCPVQ